MVVGFTNVYCVAVDVVFQFFFVPAVSLRKDRIFAVNYYPHQLNFRGLCRMTRVTNNAWAVLLLYGRSVPVDNGLGCNLLYFCGLRSNGAYFPSVCFTQESYCN